jgi:pyruvate dehydrogenase E2 component (dihydrolipoamide acetyltransferase)
MSAVIEVKVPDVGDFKDIPVIEVLVAPGATVAKDDSLITLESDKATLEVPSPLAGTVKELRLKVGDRVSEGAVILTLEAAEGAAAAAPPPAPGPARADSAQEAAARAGVPAPAKSAATPAAPAAPAAPTAAPATPAASPGPGAAQAQRARGAPAPGTAGAVDERPAAASAAGAAVDHDAFRRAHASPAIRRFARELGVDLSKVSGSAPHGRIVREDVERYVKGVMAGEAARPVAEASAARDSGAGLGLIPWPQVDFARFGPVQTRPLHRIRKISAANLHRNWVMIPHVTNHEDADVTELEALRVRLNEENAKSGVRLTLLAFLVKATVVALKKFPEFNASLDGDSLVLKQYWNIGVAADTPNGLVVPVIRDADAKGVLEIAKEMAELAAKAREGKLSLAEMQGGTFSISSLGGIGGTYFTPIINAPEVAILGVCRSAMRPVWDGERFSPRLMLPLSLSWDHRVIDGAAAARFNAFLAQLLADFRRALL